MGITVLGQLDDRWAGIIWAHGRWERGGWRCCWGRNRKINARGPRGVLEVCWLRLTCVGLGRSRDTTECHTRVVFRESYVYYTSTVPYKDQYTYKNQLEPHRRDSCPPTFTQKTLEKLKITTKSKGSSGNSVNPVRHRRRRASPTRAEQQEMAQAITARKSNTRRL